MKKWRDRKNFSSKKVISFLLTSLPEVYFMKLLPVIFYRDEADSENVTGAAMIKNLTELQQKIIK
jgi:hypothetical protein